MGRTDVCVNSPASPSLSPSSPFPRPHPMTFLRSLTGTTPRTITRKAGLPERKGGKERERGSEGGLARRMEREKAKEAVTVEGNDGLYSSSWSPGEGGKNVGHCFGCN